MENLGVWLSSSLPRLGNTVTVFVIVATALTHVLFMICVWKDANRLQAQGRGPAVLNPLAWSLAALLMGLLAVAFYWVAHYSRFARKNDV